MDWLVILNANPIYDAPADLDFPTAFNKAKIVAHLGSHYDETGHLSHWHAPAAHYLEYWSDVRAYDGTASIVQPMIDALTAATRRTMFSRRHRIRTAAERLRGGARNLAARA